MTGSSKACRSTSLKDNTMPKTLCDDWLAEHLQKHPVSKNPMVTAYGPGPEGKRCKRCIHCYRKIYAGVYYKCRLRGDTNGAGTDHRANWPACARFVEQNGGNPT